MSKATPLRCLGRSAAHGVRARRLGPARPSATLLAPSEAQIGPLTMSQPQAHLWPVTSLAMRCTRVSRQGRSEPTRHTAQQAKCPRVLCAPLVCGARALWGPRSGRDGTGRGISAAQDPPAAAAAAARRPRRRRHSACAWPGRRRRCHHILRGRAGRGRSARARRRPGAPPDARDPPRKAALPPRRRRTAAYSHVGHVYRTVVFKTQRAATKGCSR